MKKIKNSIKRFIRNSLNCIAPYTVRNVKTKKEHYVWTWSSAMEWTSCYPVKTFGATNVHNFNGDVIARKG